MKLHPYFKLREKLFVKRPIAAVEHSWSVPQLCEAYGWPANMPGGATIGIGECGGGYLLANLEAFFQSINQPMPTITDVSVDGTVNSYTGDLNGPDPEVELDIEICASSYYIATGHPANIRVYFTQDIAVATTKAQQDGCDVMSWSWGDDEANWGSEAGLAMEQVAAACTAAGMVICAAAGDNDSSDGGPTPANVDLPASAPHVIGCGGTSKTDTTEVVWNNDPGNASGEGTGGGFSTLFPTQHWQMGVPAAPASLGRMIPDIAANADPVTGWQIHSCGQSMVVGGTSCAAPFIAGLIAACGRKLGFITSKFYASPIGFIDITEGNNGLYSAAVGPDACSGMGVPVGKIFAGLLVETMRPPPPPNPTPPPPGPPTPPPPPPPNSLPDAFGVLLVKRHEGLRLKGYMLHGHMNIGYGRDLTSKGIDPSEANLLLADDFAEDVPQLLKLDWFVKLNTVRQDVIIDMTHALGVAGIQKFTKMIAAIEAGDFNTAGKEIINSLFGIQTGTRATDDAALMVSGSEASAATFIAERRAELEDELVDVDECERSEKSS